MLWSEIEYTLHFLIVTGEFFLECTWIKKHLGSFNSKKMHSSCSLQVLLLFTLNKSKSNMVACIKIFVKRNEGRVLILSTW